MTFLGNWDWKIAGKKLAIDIAIVGITGIIAVYENDPKWLIIIPIAKLVLNFLKNR